MRTIVFDIETIGVSLEQLDIASREYLTKWTSSEEDVEKVQQQMALWAPTNRIVAIGLLCVETQKGAVYFQSEKDISFEEEGILYVSGSEEEILQKFWAAIRHADRFVTFNGRCFDCPVLMLRSAMLSVRPSRTLMPYRYKTDVHVDLLDQLHFYKATKGFSLDMYCKAFGIDSPKAGGITGHDVKPLFEEGAYETIARYCAGDLWATRLLYLRWRDYLNVV